MVGHVCTLHGMMRGWWGGGCAEARPGCAQVLVEDPSAPPLPQLKPYKWESSEERVAASASLFTFSKPRPDVDGDSSAGQVLLSGIRSYKQLRRAARRRARERAASAQGAPVPAA